MVSNNIPFDFSRLRKYARYFLAFLLLIGFSFGIYTASISPFSFLSLMRGITLDPVSIVRMLCAVLLPFLIAAFAVLLSKPSILHLLLFTRAFLQGFSLYGICNCFTRNGWIVCALNLFTTTVVNTVLIRFSLRHISCFKEKAIPELVVSTLVSICAFIIEIFVILPILTVG